MVTESLAAYFADFGEPSTWKGTTPVTVIFDNAFQLGNGYVEGSNPVVTVQAANMVGVAHDDALVVRGVNYTVKGIEPDATGRLLTLQLEEA